MRTNNVITSNISFASILAPMLLVGAGVMSPAFAQGNEIFAFSRDSSTPYGRSYGDWSAAWWQWALSIRASTHPLFDKGDCSTEQSGPVWFLGGKFCASSDKACVGGVANRSCTVPNGKALFFPVVNAEDSTLEEKTPGSQNNPPCDPASPTINCLRKYVESSIDAATKLKVEVDDQEVPVGPTGVKSRFRVQSAAFDFTMPTDNVLTSAGEGPFPAGTYSLMVDDGIYVMLAPLPPGGHKLHFTGTEGSFTLDIKSHHSFTLSVTIKVK